MTTKRALKTLQETIEQMDLADQQILRFVDILYELNRQIDSMLESKNVSVHERVSKDLLLTQTPIKPGSVEITLDGNVVDPNLYSVNYYTGQITANNAPQDAVIEATYTVLGLADQIKALLAVMELTPQDFINKKTLYERAISWIEINFGEPT